MGSFLVVCIIRFTNVYSPGWIVGGQCWKLTRLKCNQAGGWTIFNILGRIEDSELVRFSYN
ncbi:hypothetical protein T10_7589 [Trichinella papuae]|uniref:Uncharacterized protein n=1 Tax=Trichinella papuae TaxID=268474 RepID=A0A0V1MHM8_9BILA|nr:hypothetical protein T10_7589 [Trichinella papuae]